MKRLMYIILATSLLLTGAFTNASASTLYAPDGRTIDVNDNEVQKWVNVGWSKAETLYAPDGRTISVSPFDTQKWINVGWLKGTTVYSPDGRSVSIPISDIEKWTSVGWYTYPVTTMYSSDGRSIVIASYAVEEYAKVGWYTYDKYQLIKHSYLAATDFHSIKRKYSTAVANGAYLYPFTDKNGDYCILVYINYKIISNYHAYFMHNITKGTVIENASDYYGRLANESWGADKLHYMNMKSDVLKAQINALKGFIGEIDSGVFIVPYLLSFPHLPFRFKSKSLQNTRL